MFTLRHIHVINIFILPCCLVILQAHTIHSYRKGILQDQTLLSVCTTCKPPRYHLHINPRYSHTRRACGYVYASRTRDVYCSCKIITVVATLTYAVCITMCTFPYNNRYACTIHGKVPDVAIRCKCYLKFYYCMVTRIIHTRM